MASAILRPSTSYMHVPSTSYCVSHCVSPLLGAPSLYGAGVLLRTEHAPPPPPTAEAGPLVEKLLDGGFSPTGDCFAATGESGGLVLMPLGSRRTDAPPEQFFASDYNALAHDAYGNALDTQHNVQPHRAPRSALCDAHLRTFLISATT